MKKIILICLFVLSFYYMNAQRFRAGFYIGAAITDIDGTDNIDNDNDFEKYGLLVAGTVSAQISKKSVIQMEIRYIRRGAQQSPVLDSNGTQAPNINNGYLTQSYNNYFTIQLNYVEVVLGLKHQIHFNYNKNPTDKFGIEEGISVGGLVNYSYEVDSYNYTSSLAVNTLDISPYVGFYYNISSHVYMEARYSNSITSALTHTNPNYTMDPSYAIYYSSWNAGHNLAFTLTLGVVFGKYGTALAAGSSQ